MAQKDGQAAAQPLAGSNLNPIDFKASHDLYSLLDWWINLMVIAGRGDNIPRDHSWNPHHAAALPWSDQLSGRELAQEVGTRGGTTKTRRGVVRSDEGPHVKDATHFVARTRFWGKTWGDGISFQIRLGNTRDYWWFFRIIDGTKLSNYYSVIILIVVNNWGIDGVSCYWIAT